MHVHMSLCCVSAVNQNGTRTGTDFHILIWGGGGGKNIWGVLFHQN